MRRYMETRYIPYIKTRYRVAAGRSIPMREYFRNAVIFIRFFLGIACLILTLSNIGNKYNNAVLTIIENNVKSIINDNIDNGILKTKNSFSESDFIEILNNRDTKILSIKNDVITANELALILSENIQSELKSIDCKDIKRQSVGIMENGILASIVMNAPCRIIPIGKVNVTPEFSIEDSGKNQKVHRLKMDITIKIKILFPFHKEEKHISRVVIVSETIIP